MAAKKIARINPFVVQISIPKPTVQLTQGPTPTIVGVTVTIKTPVVVLV